ncbi:hypothetical protein SH2C18_28920 [Clostridium sediminicola]|uniref:DUF2812 domain-containing protein n=1 Tax=Clostridium sediminicola TaxID=3114879 RepID=UPI0031F27E75
MKHIVRKAYWNYEKEENWLNEMCAKGYALVDYSWCRYVFEKCEEGEYIYRLELLEKPASNIESQKYIEFLEETGIEHVASYMRWIYCRKKSNEGKFDLFTDLKSKLKHFRSVSNFWWVLTIINLFAGIYNLMIGIFMSDLKPITNINTTLGILSLTVGILLLQVAAPVRKKIKRLKKEIKISE